jgi:hypothetical protein
MSNFLAILDDGDVQMFDTKVDADNAVAASEGGMGLVVEALRLFTIDEENVESGVSVEVSLTD